MTTDVKEKLPFTDLQMESVKSIRPDVEEITSLSTDSIIRYYAPYVIRLSPKRNGMKLKHALGIADGTIKPSSAA